MPTGTIYSEDLGVQCLGRRATVHWNLQRLAYSVKVGSLPVFLLPAVRLDDCEFIIDRRLRAQFEARPTRRTVHALIRGTLGTYEPGAIAGERVRCNPFFFSTFIRAVDEQPVSKAATIVLHPNRVIEAVGLTTTPATTSTLFIAPGGNT